jgi:hypothetical protein
MKVDQIYNHVKSHLGRDKIYEIVNEAVEAGYIKKVEKRKGNLKQGFIYYVSETPEFKKCFRHPDPQDPENRDPENQDLLSNNNPFSYEKGKAQQVKGEDPPPIYEPFREKFENKVKITTEQWQTLVDKYGEQKVDRYAAKLFRYSFANPRTFNKYKRHDLTIEGWMEDDLAAAKEKEKLAPQATPFPKNDTDLNDLQKKNWRLNQELVQELKIECPQKCGGLHFYYKCHVLKDKNNREFDLSGLINHADFCRQLDKYYDLQTYQIRIIDEKLQ